MASMSYCIAQNCLNDLKQISQRINEGEKSFSKEESKALSCILEECVFIMENLSIDINVNFNKHGETFESKIQVYNDEIERK